MYPRLLLALLLWALCATATAEAPSPGALPFSQGLTALQQGQWTTAVEKFSAAVNEDDDSAEFHLALGVAHILAEQFVEGRRELERADKLEPGNYEVRLWKAASYFMADESMEGSKLFHYGGQDTHQYAELVQEMFRNYMTSRYRGFYFDLATRQQVNVTQPVRDGFLPAAREFVARHRTGPAAEAITEQSAADAVRAGGGAAALEDLERLLQARPNDRNLLELHARAALSAGDAVTARSELTALLTHDPFAMKFYALRALAAVRMGDVVGARHDVQYAGEAALVAENALEEITVGLTATAPTASQLPAMYDQLLSAARTGNEDAALQTALKLVCTQNNWRLRADESYQRALRERVEAVRLSPDSADKLALLGAFLCDNALRVRGEAVEPRAAHRSYRPVTDESLADELQRAEQAIDAALAIDPNHVQAIAYKATCLMRRGQWRDAETCVRKALELRPTSPDLLEMLSQVLDRAASVKSSKAAGLRQVETWSDLSYTYWRRPSQAELDQADVYDAQAEQLWKLAEEHLNAAARAAAGTPRGHYYDGVIARRKQDYAAAQQSFEKAVELDPSLLNARDQLIAICSAAGKHAEAARHQFAAANTICTTAGPLLRSAWMEITRTARRSAGVALSEALRVDPSDPRCSAYMGVLQLESGKADEARAYFRAALAIIEARCRQNGETLGNAGSGRLRSPDIGLAMSILSRLGASLEEPGSSSSGAEACHRRVLAIGARMDEQSLRAPMVSAMLPDSNSDASRLPDAPRPIQFVAAAHAELGTRALAQGDEKAAEEHFAAVQKMEGVWSMTLEGRQCLAVPAARARLGRIQLLMRQNRIDEARRLMNLEGWPPELPESAHREIAALREKLTP